MTDLPLAGRTILVTRARHQAGRLSEELRARGAEVIEIPAIEIAPPDSYDDLDRALGRLAEYQWLIVTSANAVHALRERMKALGIPPQALAHLKIAAVGSATAAALREAGLQAAVTPREYVAESLLEVLGEAVRGQRVLLARAAAARDVIPDALRAREAVLDVADAYRTILPEDSAGKVRRLFEGRQIPDAATFTSSSTVTNFCALLASAGLPFPPAMRAISIGPITSQTLRDQGIEPAAEADPHDLSGLLEALAGVLGRGR